MAFTLRLRSGDVEPAPELPFDAPRVLVGRAPGSDLQLPDPSAEVPSRSQLEMMATHIMRCIHDERAEPTADLEAAAV